MDENLPERMRRLRQEAVFAVEAADYETAYSKLLAVKTIIDTAPSEQEKDGLRMMFRNFDDLLVRVERERDKANSSGKLRRVPITHRRPGLCDSDCDYD